MTNYMLCHSSSEAFKNPVRVSFETVLMDKFYDLVGKEMKNVGAHFFSHNLIKNYCQEGHTVSSFYTNPDWQVKYWKDYWDCDLMRLATYPITQSNGYAAVSWKIVDPDSDCMEERKTMCKINDGFSFEIKHSNGVLENFSFGWEKYEINKVNRQKLSKLSNMIDSFRRVHFRLNSHMFD